MQELCYVRNLKFIACHHFNRDPFIVELDQKDEDGTFGICATCDTRYELTETEQIVR